MRSNVPKGALMVGFFAGVVALLVAGLAIAVGEASVTAGPGPGALQPGSLYTSSGAGGISVTVDPPAPTESDYIKITVAGELPTPCFHVNSSHTVSGNVVYITVEAVEWLPPGMACILVITPFSITEEIGQLPAGLYTVQTTFTNLSYGPCHLSPCVEMTSFGVQEVEPTPSPTSTPTATPSPTPTATSSPAATSTPSPTPTAAPTALPSVSVPMVTGWNARCYLGEEKSTEAALGAMADKVVALYILNSDQEFDRWVPGRPDVGTITTLKPYDQLFVLMSAGATWAQQASVAERPSVALVQGWNSICYTGQQQAAADATSGIVGKFSLLQMLTESQSWARFIPDRPDLSDILELKTYDPVLVLITQEGGAEWAFEP